ncbi:MAG TPA: sigma-70 family RNA polymerase sigma factor [Thermomicrobiaceae bacterium]|nr:sigma-70 family RNA polymerase sigma factor [Thermomicrobiaceae bacterium]
MATAKTLLASSDAVPADTRRTESADAEETRFEERFRRHYATVYGVLLRLTGNPDEAEDLAQEVFLRLHQHQAELDDERLGAWLYRVALNTGFNAVRSRRRALQRLLRWARLEPAHQHGLPGPEEDVVARDEARRVRQALAGLRQRDQAVLVLRYSGVSYAEIAEATGIKPGSVGTILTRAERALRERYTAVTPEPEEESAHDA